MQIENIKIKSKCDNLELDTLLYIPKNIKGIVQISHGMSEHKERYIDFMKYLCKNGYVVIINDHRGHGSSIKSPTDLGYFYDEKANYIVEDLHEATIYIKNRFKNVPLILLGHSMGSLVVRKYIQKYDKDIDKLIVCGSPSENNMVDIAILLTKTIKHLKGDKYRSKFINNLAFSSYNKTFSGTSLNRWICSNEEVVKEYDNDNLCGFIFTTNGFLNLFYLVKDVYTKNMYQCNNNSLPIYFIAGNNDPVIINKEKWLNSIDFLSNIGYQNITSKLYPNMRHEILNETNKDIVYQDILKFID